MGKRGRPTIRTDDICQKVVDRLASGTPLTVACLELGISTDAVYDWEREDEELKRRIARAREYGYDAIAERTRETARGMGDSTADVHRDKLIIDTDLKLLAKWSKRYADRTIHAGDADAPIRADVSVTFHK